MLYPLNSSHQLHSTTRIHPSRWIFPKWTRNFFGCQEQIRCPSSIKHNNSPPISFSLFGIHIQIPFLNSSSTSIPWEFESKNAIRSISPPIFMTLLPLKISQYICQLTSSVKDMMHSKLDLTTLSSLQSKEEKELVCYADDETKHQQSYNQPWQETIQEEENLDQKDNSIPSSFSSTCISRGRLLFWIAFNVIFFVFFGMLHQSGVIPSLL